MEPRKTQRALRKEFADDLKRNTYEGLVLGGLVGCLI